MDDRFPRPGLIAIKGQDLPLSGQALQELMRAVLAKGLPFRFCARGWSMTPFIRDGDVITVAPLHKGLPKIGEVVAFVRPESGKLVVHRVVARQASGVFIQGDNGQGYADGLISQEHLLGQITRIERNGRAVWVGLGPERAMIAWLSRTFLLTTMRDRLATWIKIFTRQS